jgi:hypothetical protein
MEKKTNKVNNFFRSNNKIFNEYRKKITGIAAGEKEIEMLNNSIPKSNLSAESYLDKLRNMVDRKKGN